MYNISEVPIAGSGHDENLEDTEGAPVEGQGDYAGEADEDDIEWE